MKNNISAFKFKPFSKKQLQILTWWTDTSPVKDADGIICDGSIRAGKTIPMSLSFVMWSNTRFDNENFAICGKTIGSLRRNVVKPLEKMCRSRGFLFDHHRAENYIEISKNGHTNLYYLFGGKDEASQDLIQGITLAGILFDEVALMPESFVSQGDARCSVEGAKLWYNCNPENPYHFVKTEYIDKAKEKNLLHIHFTLDDNLSLSEKTKARYQSWYSGVFYKRFILGLWVIASGAIYDMFDSETNTYDVLPIDKAHRVYRRFIPIDYGTTNPCVFLEMYDDCQGYHYAEREYYYDSKKQNRQKDDAEYVDDLEKFIGDEPYQTTIVDPSAASLKTAMHKRHIRTRDADNDVRDGISLVGTLFAQGRLKINRNNCPNLLREITAYVWNDKRTEKGVEEPLKQNDHAMDALRYYVKTIVGGYRSAKGNSSKEK